MKSPKYKFNREDLQKIGRGALLAMGGALVVYATDILPMVDWGSWAPVATGVGAILLNSLRKWVAGQATSSSSEE